MPAIFWDLNLLFIPKRGTIKKETFATIKDRLNDLNARVELENSLIYSSEDNSTETATDSSSLLGSGLSNYFCIPPNEKLLQYWETVEDRLFKIRNCKDINGVTRRLALFAPPIDPAALIKAKSAGLDLSDILANLNTPAPHYRFSYLLQKANEFCNDVKGLGIALLSAIEKQDGEALSRLRSVHEIEMLQMIQKIKERQKIDAEMVIKQLLKQRETAVFRFAYYNEALLGNEPVEIPDLNDLEAELTDINQIIINPPIPERETDVSIALVDSNEEGLKIISKEKEDLRRRNRAMSIGKTASEWDNLASVLAMIPQFSADGTPLGVGATTGFGGRQLSSAMSIASSHLKSKSSIESQMAGLASTTASYIRREQEWEHQAKLVAKEIGQIERQILSAGIRLQVAEKELKNHKKQIENANNIETYLKEKFTNKELYAWMKDQLKSLHKQSYDLAFEMARKAELAFQFEKGDETESYLEYDYWDSGKYGLLAGEKLQMALRQLDVAYQEKNTREFELTKHISLRRLNPIELLKLKVTGKIEGLKVPEWLFDIDCPGHYKRRIKRVGISIPAIAGSLYQCEL
ncbi:hypothetical protein M601_018980 [Cellulophaga baltica 4]|nr:hypothetical protein M601_018980 [Cellulophaga baltica 4]